MKADLEREVQQSNRALLARLSQFPPRITTLLVSAIAVGVLGSALLLSSHAATPAASVESESGTVSSAAAKVTDTSASGSSAVKFGSGSTSGGDTGCITNCTPPAPLTAGKTKWNLAFDQEFDGTDYDHTKLTPCFDWNTGDCTSSFNSGYEHYEPGQVTVSGGMAHLLASPLSPAYSTSACYTGSCTYKSGMLSTARANSSNSNYLYTFTYGYVEASLKPLTTQGFFAAFWMLPANPSFSYDYEVDILEQLGTAHPSDMEMHYYYNNRNTAYTPNGGGSIGGINNNNGSCPSIDYGTGQHRYGFDWEPTYVAFYIDGVKCGQFNGTAGTSISSSPMQIILDQMVSNDWQRAAAVPLTNTSLSSSLDVDYIHVFQQQ